MPNKIDIVKGCYQLIRISGLTKQSIPEEDEIALQVLDDYAAELSSTLNTGYIQPAEYGTSDPNDYSGLTAELAGPMKKMLALELVNYFGKDVPASLAAIAAQGMRSMEQLLVTVDNAQNPATLPIGSGNEYDYRSDKFYAEPTTDDGGMNFYLDEVTQLPIDWSSWLQDETLVSVTYDADSSLNLTNEAIEENTSVVTVSFLREGQFTMCALAEKTDGEKKEQKFVFNVTKCRNPNLYYCY